MSLLLALIIGIFVFIVAFILYRISLEILEDKEFFWAAIWGFFVLYAVAATALYFLSPRLDQESSVAGLVGSYFTILPSRMEGITIESTP